MINQPLHSNPGSLQRAFSTVNVMQNWFSDFYFEILTEQKLKRYPWLFFVMTWNPVHMSTQYTFIVYKKRMNRETFCNSCTSLVTDESEMNTNALFTDAFFTGIYLPSQCINSAIWKSVAVFYRCNSYQEVLFCLIDSHIIQLGPTFPPHTFYSVFPDLHVSPFKTRI